MEEKEGTASLIARQCPASLLLGFPPFLVGHSGYVHCSVRSSHTSHAPPHLPLIADFDMLLRQQQQQQQQQQQFNSSERHSGGSGSAATAGLGEAAAAAAAAAVATATSNFIGNQRASDNETDLVFVELCQFYLMPNDRFVITLCRFAGYCIGNGEQL